MTNTRRILDDADELESDYDLIWNVRTPDGCYDLAERIRALPDGDVEAFEETYGEWQAVWREAFEAANGVQLKGAAYFEFLKVVERNYLASGYRWVA